MKTLVISDLVTMRSALAQMAGICLLAYVFISFATQSIVAGAAAVAVMVPFMYFFTVSAYDETHNWELFRLTLPMTRRQVVFGRYASLLVVIAASLAVSFAFGVLLALAAGALAGSLGVVVPEGLLPQGDFVPVIFGAAVMPVVIMLVACSLALPLVLRYGVTKGPAWPRGSTSAASCSAPNATRAPAWRAGRGGRRGPPRARRWTRGPNGGRGERRRP